jgi:NhaA family Na+:H+ antiporter
LKCWRPFVTDPPATTSGGTGHSENISRTGVFFRAGEILAPATVVELSFVLSTTADNDASTFVVCEGSIARSSELAGASRLAVAIKREAWVGELASPRQAALPIAAAIGGMAVPASIYLLTSGGGPAARGWAIPMATDIAFALGTLALVAPRAPGGLTIFLAALAIVDDMGAVLVIALFYTSAIAWGALGMAGAFLSALVALNVLRVRSLTPYLVLGLGLWFFVHESGVHATIAGVLLAFTIPTRTRINAAEFSAKARGLLDHFDATETGDLLVLTSRGQQEAIIGLERASELVTAPLLRLEHALHGFSAFVVMPLFAFANAGVALNGSTGEGVTLAVILGLVVGKPLGITGAAFAAVRWRLAALPDGVSWTALHGCAWLGGIGFTMSSFIATLAFEGTNLLDSAKVGILSGSILAGIVGAILVRRGTRSARTTRAERQRESTARGLAGSVQCGPHRHGRTQDSEDDGQHATKPGFGNPNQRATADDSANHDTGRGQRNPARGDQTLSGKVKSHEGRRSNAALIPHQATEQPGDSARETSGGARSRRPR